MKEPILEPLLRHFRFRKILRHISPNSIVVDIGCGHTPHLLNRLERFIKEGTGLDQLVINGKKGKIKLVSSVLKRKIPIKSNYADHVTLIAVLEHLESPNELLKEAFRILKPGGKFLLTTPSHLNKPLLEFLAFKLNIVSPREIAEHKRYFWKSELVSVVKKAGFINIHHEYFEFFLNNFVVARKK